MTPRARTSDGRGAAPGALPRRLAAVRPGPTTDLAGSRGAAVRRLLPWAMAAAALIATFALILLMTVRITDGQYRLVQMRAEERGLEQEMESLTQDLEFHRAPQNLSVAAQEEGMVPAPARQGVVDLTTGEVRGEAEPAEDVEGEDVVDVVPPPIQSGSSAADQAQRDARERRDALPESQDEAQRQLERAQEAEGGADLHGGTLPAPRQRDTRAADREDPTTAPAGDGSPTASEPTAPAGETTPSAPAAESESGSEAPSAPPAETVEGAGP